ncbi:uncharacterized protein VNE69_06211 [Vairimorpha necatrix]|uniref:Uncharacterized protein n=1 Tax=Vairimorpha necatrix TaxID=6039 RepID=A0AAX4JDG3_9MICR
MIWLSYLINIFAKFDEDTESNDETSSTEDKEERIVFAKTRKEIFDDLWSNFHKNKSFIRIKEFHMAKFNEESFKDDYIKCLSLVINKKDIFPSISPIFYDLTVSTHEILFELFTNFSMKLKKCKNDYQQILDDITNELKCDKGTINLPFIPELKRKKLVRCLEIYRRNMFIVKWSRIYKKNYDEVEEKEAEKQDIGEFNTTEVAMISYSLMGLCYDSEIYGTFSLLPCLNSAFNYVFSDFFKYVFEKSKNFLNFFLKNNERENFVYEDLLDDLSVEESSLSDMEISSDEDGSEESSLESNEDYDESDSEEEERETIFGFLRKSCQKNNPDFGDAPTWLRDRLKGERYIDKGFYKERHYIMGILSPE